MPVETFAGLEQDAKGAFDASFQTEFDEIATIANTLCRTPQCMVMLKDQRHGWHRVSGALRLQDTPIGSTLCELALAHGDLLLIEDTAFHPHAATDQSVTGTSHGSFFAGVPFSSPNGSTQGVLCLTDRVPRTLSSEQEEALILLARQLAARLQQREQRHYLEQVSKERETSATHLRASEELFRTFMNASPFLSYIKDAAGRLLFYNRSYARHFGISEQAWLGRTDEQLWSRGIGEPGRIKDMHVMEGGQTVEADERLRGADGITTIWKTYKFPCFDSSGNLLLAGLAMDITQERERKQELERYQEEMQAVNEQLRRLSVTDELTGLRNRRSFEERLELEFSMSRRRHRDLSVLLLDVDNFKRINDRRGHGAGDAVLRRLGAILRTTIRLPDLVARYGGEEFVILLPESGLEAALGYSRRLMGRVAAEIWDHEPVTVSIGVAAMNESLVHGFQLVTMADEALYTAKRTGKNRVVVHGSDQS